MPHGKKVNLPLSEKATVGGEQRNEALSMPDATGLRLTHGSGPNVGLDERQTRTSIHANLEVVVNLEVVANLYVTTDGRMKCVGSVLQNEQK